MSSSSAQPQSPTTTSSTILIGLSGPSSSGKTTLAWLLRSVVNFSVVEGGKEYRLSLFVLHEDDFYKVDKEYVSFSPSPYIVVSIVILYLSP